MCSEKPNVNLPPLGEAGFTLIETLVAAMIMIILCVGVFTVVDQAIKLNTGNNIRSQAQTVLQKEAEFYRALKYVPVGQDPLLNAHEAELTSDSPVASADGTLFDVFVTIDNDPYADLIQTDIPPEDQCQFKEITIEAKLTNPPPQGGWLSNLRTKVVFQRVRLIN